MLFLRDAFACYTSEVFSKIIEMPDDFSGGVVGLSLDDLKNSQGLGVVALRKLGELFKIPSNVPVINYMILEDGSIEYVITPTFRLKDGILGFSMGDFFATIDECYDACEAFIAEGKSADLSPEILKINGDDKKLVASFTFNFTPPKEGKGGRVDKIEYSFAVGQNRKEDKAGVHLVGIFEKNADMEALIDALQKSPYTGKMGNAYTIPLKKLPLGIYYISNVDRVDETLKKKDGTTFSKTGWSFDAQNVVTKNTYSVECFDSSFVGQHIKNSGRVSLNENALKELGTEAPPLLRIASVGKDGRAILILEDLKKAGTGLSPQGSVIVRETPELLEQTAAWLIKKQLPKIAAQAERLAQQLQQEVSVAALPSAATVVDLDETQATMPF